MAARQGNKIRGIYSLVTHFSEHFYHVGNGKAIDIAGKIRTSAGKRKGLNHQAYDVRIGEQIFNDLWELIGVDLISSSDR
jgi:hypothetical protein